MGYFLKKEVENHVQKIMVKHKEDKEIEDEMLKVDNNVQEVFSVHFAYNNGELIKALMERGQIMMNNPRDLIHHELEIDKLIEKNYEKF